jgi:hypothetical protein
MPRVELARGTHGYNSGARASENTLEPSETDSLRRALLLHAGHPVLCWRRGLSPDRSQFAALVIC